MHPLGHSRTTLCRTHALIAPDSHVPAALAGWERTRGVVHISPAMGAGFVQYTATLEVGSATTGAPAGVERFVYVVEGEVDIDGARVGAGAYAYFPADHSHRIAGAGRASILVFEKMFEPANGAKPRTVSGHESKIERVAFQGDADARLQVLLPDEPAYDMAVNIFTYAPGAMLPQVECHVMEHGLLMLDGMGVYRLNESWHPVQAGDVIWMSAFCPQWFIAGGKSPSRYIYYKNVNRAPNLVRT